MIFGPVEINKESNDERIKGYTRLRTASSPRSSLEFKNRARPKKDDDEPCSASTKNLAEVVFPEPGGPIIRRWARDSGCVTIV
jgi:hypothetical protein